MMSGKELNYVRACVENEGFDYAFVHYTNFNGEAGGESKSSLVTDPEFHRLRDAFLVARSTLIDYCGLEDC